MKFPSLFGSRPPRKSHQAPAQPSGLHRPVTPTRSTGAKTHQAPASGNVVKRDQTPLWKRRGWQQKQNVYLGYYATKDGTWYGIVERRGDKFRVYIKSPPKRQISYHSKAMCFYPHPRKRSWFEINLQINPKAKDIDSILHFVERLLAESFELAAKGGTQYQFAYPPRSTF